MIPDSHCHLDLIDENEDIVISRALAGGVSPLVTIGINLESSLAACEYAKKHGNVYAAVGIHPNDTSKASKDDMGRIGEIARINEKVVAIGETGLDFYRESSQPETQMKFFLEHIKIAEKTGLTLVIHSRKANQEVLEILSLENLQSIRSVVMHCFSGDERLLEECVSRSFYISFAGPITFKNAEKARETAKKTPLHLLLCETDAPFLSPEPFRGKPNLPERVALVAEKLAEIHGIEFSEMNTILETNAKNAFGIA